MEEVFNDQEHLLRAIWPKFLKRGAIDSAAFKPREHIGELGVSVERTKERALDDAVQDAKTHYRPESGIVSLTVEQCRAHTVHMEFSPTDQKPYHSDLFADSDLSPLLPEQSVRLARLATVLVPPSTSKDSQSR